MFLANCTGCAGLALILLSAGCASAPDRAGDASVGDARSDQVAYTEVQEVGAADRIRLADNETYQPPVPLAENRLPDYPAALLAQALPAQTICVQASISESGEVTGTMPVTNADCPPPPAAFYDAAAGAVAGWKFQPAFRCVYRRAADRVPYGCAENAREVPIAVRLDYRFRFEQADGRGQVSVSSG